MTQQIIKAIRIHQYGGPEELRLEEIPLPVPQEGEVQVRVHAAGVIPADWKVRNGFFRNFAPRDLPLVLGTAFAGVITEIGSGVTGWQVGDAVFGRGSNGAYAEYITTNALDLGHKPATLSFVEAATLYGGANTAWTALFSHADLQPGQRVLIHGGAGGVGIFAVQLARWKGAEVIATASTANVEFVRSLGADTVIDYSTTQFEDVVGKVDVVLESIDAANLVRSLHVLKPGGILVSLIGPPPQDVAENLGVRAVSNAALTTSSILTQLGQVIDAGYVKPVLGPIFPLSKARQAQEVSETGHGRGRIVLVIAE
jgi:NADPH:quinone reductase-like Zn-dependent oxidoreductase